MTFDDNLCPKGQIYWTIIIPAWLQGPWAFCSHGSPNVSREWESNMGGVRGENELRRREEGTLGASLLRVMAFPGETRQPPTRPCCFDAEISIWSSSRAYCHYSYFCWCPAASLPSTQAKTPTQAKPQTTAMFSRRRVTSIVVDRKSRIHTISIMTSCESIT